MSFVPLFLALSPAALAQEAPAASGAEPVHRTLPASMPALSVRGDRGDVRVRVDPTATRSEVVATPLSWEDDCQVVFSGDSARAVVSFGPAVDGFLASTCEASVEIVLAGDTAVDLELARGAVTLTGALPPITVDLGRGEVVLEDAQALLELRVGRGRITGSAAGEGLAAQVKVGRVRLEALKAPVDVQVGLGGARLSYAAVFDGSVVAHTKLGRVQLFFPYGAWLDADLDAGLGWVRSDIPSNGDAMTHLEASSGLGSVGVGTL